MILERRRHYDTKQAFDDDDDDDAKKKKKKTFHRSRFVNTYVGYSYVYSSLYLRRYYYDYSTKRTIYFFRRHVVVVVFLQSLLTSSKWSSKSATSRSNRRRLCLSSASGTQTRAGISERAFNSEPPPLLLLFSLLLSLEKTRNGKRVVLLLLLLSSTNAFSFPASTKRTYTQCASSSSSCVLCAIASANPFARSGRRSFSSSSLIIKFPPFAKYSPQIRAFFDVACACACASAISFIAAQSIDSRWNHGIASKTVTSRASSLSSTEDVKRRPETSECGCLNTWEKIFEQEVGSSWTELPVVVLVWVRVSLISHSAFFVGKM